MNKLEALRAKLKEASENQNKAKGSGDNASFPFWNTPVGTPTTLRFLPDGDKDNPYFWAERQIIKLPFSGVIGGEYPTTNDVTVTVPCMDMFGKQCPIITGTKALWNGSPDEVAIARSYWKKRSYIFQGFVVESPVKEDEVPENPIRRFVINDSIFEIVRGSLLEPNFEDLPCEIEGGRDFKINKTKKGEWANYSTSNWSFATRSLNDDERSAIDTYGLFNLSDAKGAEPDDEGIAAIKAMFEDSLAGEPFDYDSYGQFYRPYQNNRKNNSADTSSTNDTAEKAVKMANTAVNDGNTATESKDEVKVTSTPSEQNAADIIARLRANSQS